MKAQSLVALVSGILFGLGLAVSQMMNPAKVLNFLDVAGTWDPSLAFVMGGAVVVMAIAWQLQRRRSAPWFAPAFHVSVAKHVDRKLLLGAALFGIGWGLAGFCPGPAIAALTLGESGPLLFVLAMLAGMVLQQWLGKTAG
jgi:uncharacterized protein